MATMIFIDQENNVASTLLSKERVKGAGKRVVRSHQGKVFGSASGEKASRKALGIVNKQVTTQKTAQCLKGDLKVKNPGPAARKVSEAPLKPGLQCYPEIETFVPYNPADFETFDVPEEHKLSHLSLTGVDLLVNDAKTFDSLISLEPALMEMPAFSWDSDADSLPSFLATLEEITVDMPPMLQC
ncbi:securin [Bufo bufo]|uniref:securin n=1 Tax=Bufo bufo TaxID=8384 RepID=UPI001ABE9929|nr:securin [Bufo bufo]